MERYVRKKGKCKKTVFVIVDNRNDMKNDLIRKYNVQLVPTIIMLNSDGTQYKRIESALPKDQMEQYIKGLK